MSRPGATILAVGYRRCAQITRAHGTTYHWGTLLLPRGRQRHVHAVYALCRLADDIVDAPGATEPERLDETSRRLQQFEEQFLAALDGGAPGVDPVLAAVAQTVQECRIDPDCFTRFFASMRMDLVRVSYASWPDLLGYMDGSAAVIGEMMLPVLQPRSPAAFEPARALGLAFQLTNFLRDIGEDLDRGRVYMPQDELLAFGANPAQRRVTPAWKAFMDFQFARNRELYAVADRGLAVLPPASARCVGTARVLYSRLLERIEAADYDVFSSRARVPTTVKALTAARALVAPRRTVGGGVLGRRALGTGA